MGGHGHDSVYNTDPGSRSCACAGWQRRASCHNGAMPDKNGLPEGMTPDEYRALTSFDNDWRDLWWNQDFLQLMAERWRLDQVQRALDVGCGVGHFGQRLASFLPATATMLGIDITEDVLVTARERAAARGLGERFTYRHGSALALPLADSSVDLVTFQTVLIHLGDPHAAIAEALRVLVPGGLLVAAEPSQLATATALLGSHPRLDDADVLTLLELHQICTRGKRAMGDGDNNVGELLPGFFQQAGLVDIRAVNNDRCAVLIPPYEAPDQRLDRDTILAWMEADTWDTGPRDHTLRRYLAGGGDEARFEHFWDTAIRVNHTRAAQLRAGELHGGRGFVQYVVWGRKPG